MAFASILELCRPCQGAHWTPVWVKSGPSLAKGSTKRIVFREKGHLAKTILFTMFSCCLGGLWQALGSSRAPLEAFLEARDFPVPAQGHKGNVGSMEAVANGRKWTQMDATGLKPKPDQGSKSI